MLVRQLFDAATSSFTYLVADRVSRIAALIDPVREHVDRDLALIAELDLALRYVLDTHLHADHVTGAGLLREKTGARTCASKRGAECVDQRLSHGDRIAIGDVAIEVLETPGHTDDSVSYRGPGCVFTGDTLLVRGTGRTDFQNGDSGQLYDSLTRTLFVLPDETIVYPAHDYRGFSTTTIGEEKRFNPRVAGKTREEFVAILASLALAYPKNIDVALPANKMCGKEH